MTTDTRVMYCHTNNCTSRDACLYPHVTPTAPYFFGQGGDKEQCEDFVRLTNESKPKSDGD